MEQRRGNDRMSSRHPTRVIAVFAVFGVVVLVLVPQERLS
jgi:hypothetical protein